jgi:hypothetical protein
LQSLQPDLPLDVPQRVRTQWLHWSIPNQYLSLACNSELHNQSVSPKPFVFLCAYLCAKSMHQWTHSTALQLAHAAMQYWMCSKWLRPAYPLPPPNPHFVNIMGFPIPFVHNVPAYGTQPVVLDQHLSTYFSDNFTDDTLSILFPLLTTLIASHGLPHFNATACNFVDSLFSNLSSNNLGTSQRINLLRIPRLSAAQIQLQLPPIRS